MIVSKEQLTNAVNTTKSETTASLQIVFDNLNKGQQQKLLKNEDVLLIFNRYNVNIE